jgi:hypothetical protein
MSLATLELTGALSATTAVMVLGVFLFILYDRQYYAKTLKSSIIHSTAFTIGISLLSVCFFNQLYSFNQATTSVRVGQVVTNQSIPWLFEIIRIAIFIASAPSIAYLLSKLSGWETKLGGRHNQISLIFPVGLFASR